jgi:hypothetical protein
MDKYMQWWMDDGEKLKKRINKKIYVVYVVE